MLGKEDGVTMLKFVVNITLPALIFNSLTSDTTTPIFNALETPLIFFFSACYTFFASISAFLVFRGRGRLERNQLVGTMAGVNLGTFAYPFMETIWGNQGLQLAALFDIPNGVTVFGIVTAFFAATQSEGGKIEVKKLVLRVVTFPPMFAIIAAAVVALSGEILPKTPTLLPTVGSFLAPLASANRPLVLVTLGVLFQPSLPREQLKTAIQFLALKYTVSSCLAGFSTILIPSSMGQLRFILPALLLMPVPSVCLKYAIDYKCDTQLAGCLVNFSQVVSLFMLLFVAVMSTVCSAVAPWVLPCSLFTAALSFAFLGSSSLKLLNTRKSSIDKVLPGRTMSSLHASYPLHSAKSKKSRVLVLLMDSIKKNRGKEGNSIPTPNLVVKNWVNSSCIFTARRRTQNQILSKQKLKAKAYVNAIHARHCFL